MADPHWTSYVGMATGIIGALTGMIGYRKASNLKSLDLRLELRKEINSAHSNIKQLDTLINSANGSKIAVFAARGLLRSSMTENWKASVATDENTVQILKNNLPQPEANFQSYSQFELESKLIEIHKINSEIAIFTDKYNGELAKDDENRRTLQEDRRLRHQQS